MRSMEKKIIAGLILLPMLFLCLTGCGKSAGEDNLRDTNTAVSPAKEEKTIDNTMSESEETGIETGEIEELQSVDKNSSFLAISSESTEIEWAIYSEGAYCYGDGSCSGYLSEDGEEITRCIYEEAAPFSEGLACVCLNGKYGYIGKDGKEIISCRYDQAASFREGAAYFSCGEEYGLIDHNGNVILDLTNSGFGSISSFREGLAYFSQDGLYGYMDKRGEIVIEPVYGDAGYFYDGLAKVMKDGLFGLIGKDGREVLSPEYSDIQIGETSIIAQKNGDIYCFDKDGKEIFSGEWDNAWEEENIYYIENDGKIGLADQNGKVILEPEYLAVVKIPEEELAIVQDEREMYGVMDYEREVRLPFEYSYIRYVEGGLQVKEADTEKMGFLSRDDLSVKIPVIYDNIYDFTGERAVVVSGEKCGIVHYDGTLEMPVEYDEIRLLSDGSMFARKEGQSELTDGEGTLIFPGDYESICDWGEGYQIDLLDGGVQYVDSQGAVVAVDKYSWPDSVYGAENSHLLYSGTILKSGEETEEVTEQFLLSNQITPGAGLLCDYLKTGSIRADTGGPEFTTRMENMSQGKRFSKLYRTGDKAEVILYFYAAPWRRSTHRETDSGLFAVRNGTVEQLVGANECGGSIGGDWACFWYDTKEGVLKPGAEGSWGGWGGHASGGDVYELKDGQAVLEMSFMFSWSPAPDDGQEVDEYTVNDEEVSEGEYHKVKERYRYYMPIDNSRIW